MRQPDPTPRARRRLAPLLAWALVLGCTSPGPRPEPVPEATPAPAEEPAAANELRSWNPEDDGVASGYTVAGTVDLDGEVGFVVLHTALDGRGRAGVWFVRPEGRPRRLTDLAASGLVAATCAGTWLVVRQDEGDTIAWVDLAAPGAPGTWTGSWRRPGRGRSHGVWATREADGVRVVLDTRDGVAGALLTEGGARDTWTRPGRGALRVASAGDVDGDGGDDVLVIDELGLRVLSPESGSVLAFDDLGLLPAGSPSSIASLGGRRPTTLVGFGTPALDPLDPRASVVQLDTRRREVLREVRRASEVGTASWPSLGRWVVGADGGTGIVGDGRGRAFWIDADGLVDDAGFALPDQGRRVVTGHVSTIEGVPFGLVGTAPQFGGEHPGRLVLWKPGGAAASRIYRATAGGLR